jgi:hypothetical protein
LAPVFLLAVARGYQNIRGGQDCLGDRRRLCGERESARPRRPWRRCWPWSPTWPREQLAVAGLVLLLSGELHDVRGQSLLHMPWVHDFCYGVGFAWSFCLAASRERNVGAATRLVRRVLLESSVARLVCATTRLQRLRFDRREARVPRRLPPRNWLFKSIRHKSVRAARNDLPNDLQDNYQVSTRALNQCAQVPVRCHSSQTDEPIRNRRAGVGREACWVQTRPAALAIRVE